MKKIATITFHSSYNYGSCLQAYALQEYIKKLHKGECEYKIINLRTDIQKEMYRSVFERKGIKNGLKKLLFLNKKNELELKQENFERFIQDNLQITQEFNSYEQLKEYNWRFDYYIAGSDQLWNTAARDFDWANYLEFIDNDNKISYAASFGPRNIELSEIQSKRISDNLKKFKCISVREEGSQNKVKELIGREAEINVDPTILLNKEEWEELISDKKIYEGKYIFLYNLKGKEYTKLAEKISKELKLPIVVSHYGGRIELINGFKKRYDCGPREFLNLIKNAELVLSSSFHGTVFSILLNKPFFALNGLEDLRIATLLKNTKLEGRSINEDDYKQKCKKAFDINFDNVEKILEHERKKTSDYLTKALEIN